MRNFAAILKDNNYGNSQYSNTDTALNIHIFSNAMSWSIFKDLMKTIFSL